MYCVVFITTKNKEEGKKIAEKLVEKKLAACVNIVDTVHSLFWWEGKVDDAKESLLVVKTKEDLFDSLVKTVKSLHSYTVPEIIALPIIKGNDNYLDWIKDSVK